MAGAGIAVLFVVWRPPSGPPAPPGPAAFPAIFSAFRARAILKDLVGDDLPHPIGSAGNAKVRERIAARLTALGYTTELQTGLVCNDFACGTPTNIVATYGTDAIEHAVLLAAHYDSV